MPRGIRIPAKQIPKRLHLEIPSHRQELIRAVQMRALRKGVNAKELAAEVIEKEFSYELQEMERK